MPPAPADPFSLIPIVEVDISFITIPPERQRLKAKADEGLVDSIRANGLFAPIIIRANHTLVAGERRLDAFRQLGRSTIPARIFEHLSTTQAHLVELHENLQRKNLTWQEETRAIAAYHTMREADAIGWTIQGTASEVGISLSHTYRILAVARFLDDPDVASATTFTGAFNLIDNRANRAIAAAESRGLIVADAVSASLLDPNASKEEKTAILLAGLSDPIAAATVDTSAILDKFERGAEAVEALRSATPADAPHLDERILNISFHDWVLNYRGPKFDVAHCDFPYGKGYTGSRTRKTGTVTALPTYADKDDVYFDLVLSFLEHQDTFLLPQAHCIFWFDMMHYTWTIDTFAAAGWRLVQPFPLIWTKGHQGVAADTKRRPRHCYETALFFSRGDRHLRNLVNDHFAAAVDDDKLHLSQKPVDMLSHFLSLVIDEHTSIIDPTCGSGTALVAAGQLGASSILGLEIDEANADVARFHLKRDLD